jgi:hypothetical protein
MTLDWAAHNDALYDTFGVSATLTIKDNEAAAVVTVIDKVRGSEIVSDGMVTLQGASSWCAVRKAELDESNIELAELDGGFITFNGIDWRIEAHRLNSPDGESTGEVWLSLCRDEGDT